MWSLARNGTVNTSVVRWWRGGHSVGKGERERERHCGAFYNTWSVSGCEERTPLQHSTRTPKEKTNHPERRFFIFAGRSESGKGKLTLRRRARSSTSCQLQGKRRFWCSTENETSAQQASGSFRVPSATSALVRKKHNTTQHACVRLKSLSPSGSLVDSLPPSCSLSTPLPPVNCCCLTLPAPGQHARLVVSVLCLLAQNY